MTQKREPKRALRVFLSYAQDDRHFADMLRQRLSRYPGVSTSGVDDFSGGRDLVPLQIREAIRNCDLFFALVSEHAVNSPWVMNELGAAWVINKRVVAIVVSDVSDQWVFSTLPIELKEVQYVSFEELAKRPEGISKLLEEAQSEAE